MYNPNQGQNPQPPQMPPQQPYGQGMQPQPYGQPVYQQPVQPMYGQPMQPPAPKKSKTKWIIIGVVVVVVIIIVVGILASLSTPAPLTIVQNGVVFNINPRTAQPVGFNLSQSATITGSFTTSAPVTFYIMTPSEYASLLPSGTASSYVYTSGSVSSGSINTNVGAGTYYLVFVNYNSLTTDTVQITAAFVATAS